MLGALFALLASLRTLNAAGYLTLLVAEPLESPGVLRRESELLKSSSPQVEKTVEEFERLVFEGFYQEKPEDEHIFHIRKIKLFLKCMDYSTFYTFLSFRLMMYSIPVAVWLVSNVLFLVFSIILVIFLIYNDWVPGS